MSELEDDSISDRDVAQATLVTMLQIRDYMGIIAFHAAPEVTASVEATHKRGKIAMDLPFLSDEG